MNPPSASSNPLSGRPAAAPSGLAERPSGRFAAQRAAPDSAESGLHDRPRHQQLPGGDPATGHVAIDPGPDEPAHLERLWPLPVATSAPSSAPTRIPDHSPGFRPAAGAGRRQPAISAPPILVWAAARMRHDSRFTPERELADGERVLRNPAGEILHTLCACCTPGHTANHPAWCWRRTGCCSAATMCSTAAPPWSRHPDGNMNDHLDLARPPAGSLRNRRHRLHPAGARPCARQRATGDRAGSRRTGWRARPHPPPRCRRCPRARPTTGQAGLFRHARAALAGGQAVAAGPCAKNRGLGGFNV